MERIVVGVDGSSGSLEAFRWALAEAGLRGAEVRVVHAWMVPLIDAVPEPWAIGSPSLRPSENEVHEHLEAAAKKVLDASMEESRSADPGVEIKRELAEGRPAAALLAAAQDADLLVVGSRGRGGFAGLRLGSVSAQCVHHAPCPVVVVPPEPAS